MLDELMFFDTLRQGLWIAVIISAPILTVALVAGLIIGLFQALTSVQEQTMSMVPKMFAVTVVTLLLLAPAVSILREYTLRIFEQLNRFGLS